MYNPLSLPGMMLDPADPINRGLVGWWPLNEGGGRRANDKSLRNNSGLVSSLPTWSGSQLGYGLTIGATASHGVTVPSNASLICYPITVSAWIKTITSDAAVHGITTNYLSGSFNGVGFFVLSGNIRGWYFKNSTNYVWDGANGMNGGAVNDGKWHFVAMTIDANGGVMYADGVRKATMAWAGTAGAYTTTEPFCIGILSTSTGSCSGTGTFNGSISNTRIWNRALSATEIMQLYTQPSVGLYSPNIGKYFVSAGALATSLFDGKIIIKSSGTNLLDGKVQIKDVVTALLDGKVAIGSVQQSLLDGKLTVKDTAVSFLDGKVMVKDIATSLLDGKLDITQGGVGLDTFDGKIQIKDALTALVDGKVIVKSVATDLLDGKLTIGTLATSVFDGKVQIKDIATALLDGKIQVKNATVDLLDGKIIISDGVTSFSKNNQLLLDSIGGKVLQLGNTRINSWNTAGRPASPKTGTIGLNTQTVALDIYDGSNWKSVTLS